MATFGERLLQAITERFGERSQAECARHLGMQPQQLNTYTQDQSYPSAEVLIKIAQVLNVSSDWLLMGIPGPEPRPVKDALQIQRGRNDLHALIQQLPDAVIVSLLPLLRWLRLSGHIAWAQRESEHSEDGESSITEEAWEDR